MDKKQNLIWIDLEMTGLSPKTDVIIEIATVVTDKTLNVLAEGPVLAIYQPDNILIKMDEWNTNQHTKSGLKKRVQNSNISVEEAEQQTLDFVKKWTEQGTSPMCGNSICQDRRFLVNYMPDFEQFFNYRHLDVSTLKILANLWKPEIGKKFIKQSNHLALDDIYDSINELKHYQKYLLQPLS